LMPMPLSDGEFITILKNDDPVVISIRGQIESPRVS
jgi:hypothetical protein